MLFSSQVSSWSGSEVRMASVLAAKDAVSHRIKLIEEKLYKYGVHIPCWFHLLVWVIAIMVLIGLTLHDIIPLVIDYCNDNRNVAIQTRLITNETFAPPTLILSIPHFKTIKIRANPVRVISEHLFNGSVDKCVECEDLADVSWDVWRDMNISAMKSNNVDIFMEIVLVLVRKLLQSIESGVDVLDALYAHWNRPLIDACLTFLTWQWKVDSSFGNPGDGNELNMLDVFYESNRKWNGTRLLDVLANRCMKAMCRETAMIVDIRGGVQYTCLNLMTQDSMPVIMTDNHMWIPMPCRSVEECNVAFYFAYGKYDPFSIWASPVNYTDVEKIWLFTDASSQYRSQFDSPLHTSSNLYSETAGPTMPRMNVVFSVAVMTVEKRDRIKEKCYKDSNMNMCLNKCSKRWIMQQCGCIPFTYRKGIDWPDRSLPYCTQKHYKACDPMAQRNAKDEYCGKQCVYPCEYNSYNWHVYRDELSTDKKPNPRNTAGFSVNYRPRISPFLEFALTTKDTPETFASQIGGILGLYLGLSGLSGFIFIVTCFEFAQRFSRRKRYQETSDKFRAISLWQMLFLNKVTNQTQAQNGNQTSSRHQSQEDNDNDNFNTLKTEMGKISSIIREQEDKNASKFEKMELMFKSELSELEAKIRADFLQLLKFGNFHSKPP